ncbi:hypothetical protein HAZT_HAZT000217 [Hyalella azteca]|uniref:Ig-like domain-containing protein n=1 Tax=Hyalella azteca TaxID=294128 RepID=A0A6A0GZ55_HYAAZ|nr:hypothetical protein HAZT_HAZT000217 [Hyalella azteca]
MVVSWVRHRDIHLLTVGRFSYTSDQRFTARHADESEDWLLKIHYLQKRDAGWYECQISTTPPALTMYVTPICLTEDKTLNNKFIVTAEPETSILGGPDVYINSGSRLVLTCSVKYSPDPPAFIFWYHNDRLVSYDHSDSGVQVVIEKGAVSTSRLLVKVAGTRHSGTYRCDPSNSGNQSVTVHVLEG